jgi:L-2,4-diaminobutyrate decarboxylase
MDKDFSADQSGLLRALALITRDFRGAEPAKLPTTLPEEGLGMHETLDMLAPSILGTAARLGDPSAFAHMDPPTPWITWAAALWNASLNQNLLHPSTAPVAREIEQQTVAWLASFFGMTGGHITAGSSLANLTGLWTARECAGVKEVLASESAHFSVAKAAHILGLQFRVLPSDARGCLVAEAVPSDLTQSALVLSAGTTSAGVIDSLRLAGRGAWTHVDAAWAGPLRLTKYAPRLAGIEAADSVSVSAHKWLFQPKESALILFRDVARAHAAISFGGAYLSAPNVGLQGSHGATAVPLLATLLAWGRRGISARIEHCMELASQLTAFIKSEKRLELFTEPQVGIVVWRPCDARAFQTLLAGLPPGACSMTTLGGQKWFRNVAANPNSDVDLLISQIRSLL